MSKEIRIVDGKLKVVRISEKGKIIEVIRDYHKKIIIPEDGERNKKENIHEINYGKRGKYQSGRRTKEISEYKKDVLRVKVNRGIIKKDILELKSTTQLLDNWSREKGFNNYDEYLNIIALGRGFTCYSEYEKIWMYYPGMPSPIKENRKDTRFLGVYIAENAVARLFKGSQKMPHYNVGYDIICPKGHRIDVKATILNRYNLFSFHINRNMVADYFVLIGFNNIIELKPLYLWIIKGDENISGCPMRNLELLSILNEPDYLRVYQKHERIDKLEELKNICKIFDAKNKVEINDYNVPSKHLILDIVLQLRLAGKNEILPTDILHIIDEKKKERIENRVPIISKDECR